MNSDFGGLWTEIRESTLHIGALPSRMTPDPCCNRQRNSSLKNPAHHTHLSAAVWGTVEETIMGAPIIDSFEFFSKYPERKHVLSDQLHHKQLVSSKNH